MSKKIFLVVVEDQIDASHKKLLADIRDILHQELEVPGLLKATVEVWNDISIDHPAHAQFKKRRFPL